MVVGPEYDAIIAVALGIERWRPSMVRRGLVALLCGFAIAIAAAVGLSLVYQSWSRAWGSALQLLLNVGLLILVGAGALRIQRRIWRPRARRGSA
jgi:hypothetical protein